MPRVSNIDRSARILKFVSMWLGQDERYMYASEIRKEAYNLKFDKKEVTRLFKSLVNENILEEVVEGPRTRKFKPKKEYWEANFQWIPIGPKANDAEFLMLSGFVSEISNKFVETSRHAIRKAPKNSLIREIKSIDQHKLELKINEFLSVIKIGIGRIAEDYFNKKIGKAEVYERLRNNLIETTKAYLDLWDFVMTTKGALWDFNDRIETLQKA